MRVRLLPTWMYPVARYVLFPILRRTHNVRFVNAELFRTLRPPFVVAGNHSTYFDGFWLAGSVPHRVSIVITDSVLHGLLGTLMRRAAVIPMTKSKFSILAIRHMLEVVARGGVIGLFPESQTTWHGKSGPVMPGTGRLLKRLGVPIVSAKIRGGYHVQPKWSRARREGSIEVSYRMVADADTVNSLPAADLEALVQEAISHDDLAYMRENDLVFPSDRGAEYLERALYHCPECGSFARLRSEGNSLTCLDCGSAWWWKGDGLLRRVREDGPADPEDGSAASGAATLPEWTDRQKAALRELVRAPGAPAGEPLFPPDGVTLLTGYRLAHRRKVGCGRLVALRDAFVFTPTDGSELAFPMAEIASCVVIAEQNFEFYYRDVLYVFVFDEPGASGLKYLNVMQIVNPDGAELIG
jgi:1-acyl-sn-glycerol-3-phosphate acyltransferase